MALILLRLGLAFGFFYAAVFSFLSPNDWNSFLAGLISAATLLGIIVFNLGALDIVFRDIGLFFAALALAFLSRRTQLQMS